MIGTWDGRWLRTATGLLVGLFLCLAAPLLAAEQNTGAVPTQKLTIGPGQLVIQALYPDQETAVSDAPVRVWSTERHEFVHQGRTDAEGGFTVPALPEGQYLLLVADRVMVELNVSAEDPPSVQPVLVIIPEGTGSFAQLSEEEMAAVLAAPSGEEGLGITGSGLLDTVLVVGGGGVIAVAVADAVFEDESDREIVSP